MIRRVGDGRPAFFLETERTSYVFRITPTGHAEHLFYGARLPAADEETVAALGERRSFEPGNVIRYHDRSGVVALEDTALEFSSGGHGDVREPFLEVVFADGSRSADFLFENAVITRTKPPFETLPGSYDESGEVEHLTLSFRDAPSSLRLELHYFVYPACDVITRSAKLFNDSDARVELERLLSLQIDFPEGEFEVTAFRGAWAREMEKYTVPVRGGQFVSCSRTGCSSSRANPFFMLHGASTSEEHGDCYGFNLIYSGSHYECVEKGAFGKTRVLSGISPQGFRAVLYPGESFEAPEAVMTFSADGFSGESRNMHRFVRAHIVRGAWKDKERPILINSWEACYFRISEHSLVTLAKAGRELGMELLVADDGWFGDRSDDTRALGDWEPNAKKFPHGLAGLAEKVNAAGMALGVWVEPEMISVESELYKAHPEYAADVPGRPHSEGRNERMLDLANPEVVDFVTEKMTKVFSSAPVAYVKWDMNRFLSDAYSKYLPAERQGETAHRFVLGLYRIMAALTERFPDILFEGCASGGNRFDLGILCYFPQIWGSDDTDAVERVRIQEGYSYGYPLSAIGAHVSASPNHQTLRRTPLATRFAVAAFGSLGYELDLRDLSAADKAEVAAQTALYKAWRDVFQNGDFYRVASGNETEWICVSPDKKRAVGLLFQKLAVPDTQAARFVAKGLDENAVYHFYNVPGRLDVKRFGSLINTMAPVHVRQDSLVHNAIAKAVKFSEEKEDARVTGGVLMHAGVALAPAYAGTGFDESVRVFGDFSARLYFMEAEG